MGKPFAATLFFAALLLPGCRTNETPEAQVQDARILTEVKTKLASELRLSTITNVSVNATNGVVTLAGQVNSAASKQRAGEIAQTVRGVKSVNNHLQVVPSPSQ